MYWAAPGTLQPSAGKSQTATAISGVVVEAAGGVAGLDAAGDVVTEAAAAGLVAPAAECDGGVCPPEWFEVVGADVRTSASVAPTAAATTPAPPSTIGQRPEERRRGTVSGPGSPGGAVVPAG